MYAEFAEDGERTTDFTQVQARVAAENAVVGEVSPEPILITVVGDHLTPMTLIDLPGFIISPTIDQPEDLAEQIAAVNKPYMNDPLSQLCVVTTGTTDPATSLAIKEARKADPTGQRSTGIITKVDLVGNNKDSLVNLLLGINASFYAGGRFGVRCRTQSEQLENIPFSEVIQREKKWIEDTNLRQHPSFDPSVCRLGIPAMRHELSENLLQEVVKELPKIITALNVKIKEAKHNEGFLRRLADEPDLDTVSKELEILVNQLHPASDSRRVFEENLQRRLAEIVSDVVSVASQRAGPQHFLRQARMLCDSRDNGNGNGNGNGNFNGNGNDKKQNNMIPDDRARKLLEKMNYKATDSPTAPLNKYNELTLYGGESHMDRWGANALDDIMKRGVTVGLFGLYFKQVMPEKPRQARSKWVQGMERIVDEMLEKNTSTDSSADTAGFTSTDIGTAELDGHLDLVARSFQAFMSELEDFSSRAAANDAASQKPSSTSVELARLYFSYLTTNIANRIKKDGLEQEMEGMVAREKRPCPELLAVQNELAKQLMYPTPKYSVLADLFGDDQSKMVVTVFGKEWTEAYLGLVSKRISDDMFRIQAVRLLERLVFESISFSLNMFSKGDSVKHEAHSQSKEAARLEKCRDVLQKALDDARTVHE